MPYIDIRSTKKIDSETGNKLQKEIAGIMELIPGKNAGNTTISISDNYTVYRDYQPVESVFIDIRMYKESTFESKEAFAKELFTLIDKTLGISQSKVQMNFIEMPCWAANGELF